MFSSWVLAELVSKALTYLAMLAVPGGFFVLLLAGRHRLDAAVSRSLLRSYVIPSGLLGIVTVSAFFLVQVGDINQRGPAGMFDREMGLILATTAIGDGLQWRLNGFVLALVAGGLVWLSLQQSSPPVARWQRVIGSVAAILAALAFGFSFTVLGHVVNLPTLGHVLIVLHLIAVSLWGGALLPLIIVARHIDSPASRPAGPGQCPQESGAISLFKEYGQLAWVFLSVMLISGIGLLLLLLDSPAALFSTSYGRLLLIKLAAVATLLGLGALNKYRLVPQLASGRGAWTALRRSMAAEFVLLLLVFSVTAMFTTIVGPA